MRRAGLKLSSHQFIRLVPIVLLLGVGLFYFSRVYGIDFQQRSLTMGDARTGATTSYKLSLDLSGSETLGSIELQLCANSPLDGDPCVAPAGFDISAATLSSQTGETGFSIRSASTTANSIVLTRFPAVTTSTNISYEFGNVTNPSSSGTFYARAATFSSQDATGAYNEFGGMALTTSTMVQISTYVPPYLLFCLGVTITGFDCANASGDYVNFGNLSDTSTKSATTQMLTATNAGNGFDITVNGTTMMSGTNAINGIASADVSRPGTSQFGLNLVANNTPSVGANPQGGGNAAPASGYNVPNFYKFVPGDVVVSDSNTDAFRLFTTSYVVNVPNKQPVGVYVSTLTYICLANF